MSTKKNTKNLLDKHSSKIKDIYIELKDYTFFHRPTGIDKEDRRFIGRKKIIEKIKAILTHSEAKSGAYLITGFRGMGKTSVVHKVLAGLKGASVDLPPARYYLMILFWVLVFSLFDVLSIFACFFPKSLNLGNLCHDIFSAKILLLVIIPFLIGYLAWVYYKNNNIKIHTSKKILKELFTLNNVTNTPIKSLLILSQAYLIASLIHLLANVLLAIWIVFGFIDLVGISINNPENHAVDYYNKFQAYIFVYLYIMSFLSFPSLSRFFFGAFASFILIFFIFFLLFHYGWNFIPLGIYLFIIICACAFRFWKKDYKLLILGFLYSTTCLIGHGYFKFNLIFLLLIFFSFLLLATLIDNQNDIFNKKRTNSLIKNITDFFRYSDLIHIKINLAQDNLQEKDILRLIAKTILNKYELLISPYYSPRRFLWKFFIAFLFYFICLVIYYYQPTYAIINNLRSEFKIAEFFPSQAIFGSNVPINTSVDLKILDDIEKSAHINSFDLVEYAHAITETLQKELIRADYIQLNINTNDSLQIGLAKNDSLQIILSKKNLSLNKIFLQDSLRIILYKNDSLQIGLSKIDSPEIILSDNDSLEKHLITKDSLLIDLTTKDSTQLDLITVQKKDSLYIFLNKKTGSDSLQVTINTNGVSTIQRYINNLPNNRSVWHKYINNSISNKITTFIDYMIFVVYTETTHFLYNAVRKIPSGTKKNETTRNSSVEIELFNKNLDLHPNLHIIPPRLDYMFLIFLLLSWIIKELILASGILGIVTHDKVLKRLKELEDSIEASISLESGMSMGASGNISKGWSLSPGFSKTKKKNYAVIGERDIENELIKILELTERIPSIGLRPKFIFVFDELDKIEPSGSYGMKEENEKNEKADTTPLYTIEGTKKREYKIARILANLKHFFNTAKAKFIFIAGREMYDAALADISDRDSFIGSIFHDVIYVNSFYTDPYDEKLSDITSMTENYVCQFLLDPNGGNKTLKEFYKYITTHNEKMGINEIAKIIFTLQNFITYLTYRSNGAPKKITKIFEEYIHPLPKGKALTKLKENAVFVGESDHNLYLHFSFYDQYIFGFSSYLFSPFLLSVSKYLRDFGDKLLVSTSFLLNHIYKYHGSGFSYRTLELTPEIIAVNRAPELRPFIDSLLRFLARTHIREIVSGLHQFRFNSKIDSEINYISKVSERESSAYNFTLDESLTIKKLYRQILNEVMKTHGGKSSEKHITSVAYLNAILGDLHYHDQEYDKALLHYADADMNLKEVEFEGGRLELLVFYLRNQLKLGLSYEKKRNYDDALLIYEELKNKVFKLLIANKQTNIKEKEEDEQLLHSLLKEITLLQGNKETKIIIEKNVDTKAIKESIENSEESNDDKNDEDNENRESNNKQNNGENGNNQNDKNSDQNNGQSESDKNLASIIAGLRLLYQPILAELQLIEKHTIKSLTKKYVRDNKKQFHQLINVLEEEQRFLIKAEYYDKMGDILYYKNGLLFGDPEESSIYAYNRIGFFLLSHINKGNKNYSIPVSAYENYLFSLYILMKRVVEENFEAILFGKKDEHNTSQNQDEVVLDIEFIIRQNTNFYLDKDDDKAKNSCKRYVDIEGLISEKKIIKKEDNSVEDYLNSNEIVVLTTLAQFIVNPKNTKKFPSQRKAIFTTIGNSLSDTGDCLLTFVNLKEKKVGLHNGENILLKENKITLNNFKKICDLIGFVKEEIDFDNTYFDNFNCLELSMAYYCLAALYFYKAGEYKEYAFQLSKLLYVLNEYLTNDNKGFLKEEIEIPRNDGNNNDKVKLIKFIEEVLVAEIIRANYKAHDNTSEAEIKKYTNIFDVDDMKKAKEKTQNAAIEINKLIYNNISASLDIREIVTLFNEIKLIAGGTDDLKIEKAFINPFSSINSKFNRISELKYKCKYNYNLYLKKHIKISNTIITEDDYAEFGFLILDSINCLYNLIKSHRIFGTSYIFNHSWLAFAYEKMGWWCEQFQIYQLSLDSEELLNLDKQLENLIGKVEMDELNPINNYEKALQQYEKVLEMHSEGEAYRSVIKKMYYLDDSFNDNLYHFCAAIERFRINNGIVNKAISNLQGKVTKSELYKFENYNIH